MLSETAPNRLDSRFKLEVDQTIGALRHLSPGSRCPVRTSDKQEYYQSLAELICAVWPEVRQSLLNVTELQLAPSGLDFKESILSFLLSFERKSNEIEEVIYRALDKIENNSPELFLKSTELQKKGSGHLSKNISVKDSILIGFSNAITETVYLLTNSLLLMHQTDEKFPKNLSNVQIENLKNSLKYYMIRLSGVNFLHFSQISVVGESLNQDGWQLKLLCNENDDGFDVYVNTDRLNQIAHSTNLSVGTLRCPAHRAGTIVDQLVEWTFDRFLKMHLLQLKQV